MVGIVRSHKMSWTETIVYTAKATIMQVFIFGRTRLLNGKHITFTQNNSIYKHLLYMGLCESLSPSLPVRKKYDSNWSCKNPNNQGTSSEIQSNLSSIEPSNGIYIQLYPMTSSLKLRTSPLWNNRKLPLPKTSPLFPNYVRPIGIININLI